MRVFVCFDKFKDSMSADKAVGIAKSVFTAQLQSYDIHYSQLTDGGEGFCSILTREGNGTFVNHIANNPGFEKIGTVYGYCNESQIPKSIRKTFQLKSGEKLGIIEMAQASGLQSLPIKNRNCQQASSYGTGELLLKAATQGMDKLLLGVGGSATSDLGLGALEALGLNFLDNKGNRIDHIVPKDWKNIQSISGKLPEDFPPLHIACDVKNPLFGPNGAAAVYGPQKGLPIEDIPDFETEAKRIAKLLCTHFGKPDSLFDVPGTGAAGGITFGLMVALGAQLIPGFDLVSKWLRLETKISQCDHLITGEGKFDESSMSGKGPGMLVKHALDSGKSVTVLAGKIDLQLEEITSSKKLRLIQISPQDIALEENLSEGPKNLKSALLRLAAEL